MISHFFRKDRDSFDGTPSDQEWEALETFLAYSQDNYLETSTIKGCSLYWGGAWNEFANHLAEVFHPEEPKLFRNLARLFLSTTDLKGKCDLNGIREGGMKWTVNLPLKQNLENCQLAAGLIGKTMSYEDDTYSVGRFRKKQQTQTVLETFWSTNGESVSHSQKCESLELILEKIQGGGTETSLESILERIQNRETQPPRKFFPRVTMQEFQEFWQAAEPYLKLERHLAREAAKRNCPEFLLQKVVRMLGWKLMSCHWEPNDFGSLLQQLKDSSVIERMILEYFFQDDIEDGNPLEEPLNSDLVRFLNLANAHSLNVQCLKFYYYRWAGEWNQLAASLIRLSDETFQQAARILLRTVELTGECRAEWGRDPEVLPWKFTLAPSHDMGNLHLVSALMGSVLEENHRPQQPQAGNFSESPSPRKTSPVYDVMFLDGATWERFSMVLHLVLERINQKARPAND